MFFKDVAGHQELKKKLIQNIRNGRISHAQLFLGPEGSGKLALAIAYARYLACREPGEEDACGKCTSCIKYNKLAHPDLNFFFPNPAQKKGETTLCSKDYITPWREYLLQTKYVTLNEWYNKVQMENKQGIISTADCSEIIRVLGYTSYESEYKVVIIWMIERLYHSAAPKLLKILEEPPEKTLFLLVSESQDQVLPTILSRTQLVKVNRLSDNEIKAGLIDLYGFDPGIAAEAAFQADGNFYRAMTLCGNDESAINHTNTLKEWFRSCYRYDPKAIIEQVEKIAKTGREKQKNLLNFALEIFRQCTFVNYQVAELVKTHPVAGEFIGNFSKVLQPQIAAILCEEFSKAIYHIERNANPKILFTDLSLKITSAFKQAKK